MKLAKINAQSFRLLTLSSLLFFLLFVAILVVHTKHLNRQNFSELQTIEFDRDEMNYEWWQLQLERSTLAAGSVIDSMAREKLGMNQPENKEMILIKP